MVNGNRNTDAIASGVGKDAGETFQNVFYYGKTLGVYNTFWIAIIIFIVFFFLLSKTRTGRHIYAIGSNVDAAKLSRRQRSKDHHQDLSGQCILFFCGRIDPLRSGRNG